MFEQAGAIAPWNGNKVEFICYKWMMYVGNIDRVSLFVNRSGPSLARLVAVSDPLAGSFVPLPAAQQPKLCTLTRLSTPSGLLTCTRHNKRAMQT